MKKTLLSLGTIVSTIAPVASVIACGDGDVPGHEAPYKITISADGTTPSQANVEISLKGYVSDSYLKEIKSRIAESIVAANKDTLKYSTIKIIVTTWNQIWDQTKLINANSLTDANKNDLEAVFNFIDTPFDDLINRLKSTHVSFGTYFQKELWENQHNQIDQLDQNEIKSNLLKFLTFTNTNPNLIDFKYGIISDKLIDIEITRTSAVASPELYTNNFMAQDTNPITFLEGESINFKAILDDNNLSITASKKALEMRHSKTPSKNGSMPMNSGRAVKINLQVYKIVQYLLKANGYNKPLKLYEEERDLGFNFINSGNSATKVFAYGDNGRTNGLPVDVMSGDFKHTQIFDFDKKTFKIEVTFPSNTQKQWVFGKNGDHLIVEPTKEFTLTLEGACTLNDTNAAIVDTISSLTKASVTCEDKTIDILETSAKIMAKEFLNDITPFVNH